MRFALSEDHLALQVTVRGLLDRLCPPAVVRAAWWGPPDSAPWEALMEVGALAALAPQSCGGLGLDETYLVAVLEEAGRAALPHPLNDTALVAAPLGVVGPMVATNLGAVRCAPAADDQPRIVAAAAFAEAFLVATTGSELRLYGSDEVDLEPLDTVDGSRGSARVRPRGQGELVTTDPQAITAAFDRGVLGAAAELVGLCRRMLELTVAYTGERHQFGKPIGSFQAVKHHLADARVQLEFAGPAVLYAAHCASQGQSDASRSASRAKYLAGVAARVVGRVALQCHGAIGYTCEHDLHLYLKRSWALVRSWGDSGYHADRVSRALGL